MVDRLDVVAGLLVLGLVLVGAGVGLAWGLPALLAYAGVAVFATGLAGAVLVVRRG